MHQYETLAIDMMLSLLENGDLTSWWKLMHIKGMSKITVNKIRGENTLSARVTVSQSLPCSSLRDRILETLGPSVEMFFARLSNIWTKNSHET